MAHKFFFVCLRFFRGFILMDCDYGFQEKHHCRRWGNVGGVGGIHGLLLAILSPIIIIISSQH